MFKRREELMLVRSARMMVSKALDDIIGSSTSGCSSVTLFSFSAELRSMSNSGLGSRTVAGTRGPARLGNAKDEVDGGAVDR